MKCLEKILSWIVKLDKSPQNAQKSARRYHSIEIQTIDCFCKRERPRQARQWKDCNLERYSPFPRQEIALNNCLEFLKNVQISSNVFAQLAEIQIQNVFQQLKLSRWTMNSMAVFTFHKRIRLQNNLCSIQFRVKRSDMDHKFEFILVTAPMLARILILRCEFL